MESSREQSTVAVGQNTITADGSLDVVRAVAFQLRRWGVESGVWE